MFLELILTNDSRNKACEMCLKEGLICDGLGIKDLANNKFITVDDVRDFERYLHNKLENTNGLTHIEQSDNICYPTISTMISRRIINHVAKLLLTCECETSPSMLNEMHFLKGLMTPFFELCFGSESRVIEYDVWNLVMSDAGYEYISMIMHNFLHNKVSRIDYDYFARWNYLVHGDSDECFDGNGKYGSTIDNIFNDLVYNITQLDDFGDIPLDFVRKMAESIRHEIGMGTAMVAMLLGDTSRIFIEGHLFPEFTNFITIRNDLVDLVTRYCVRELKFHGYKGQDEIVLFFERYDSNMTYNMLRSVIENGFIVVNTAKIIGLFDEPCKGGKK